MRDVAWAWDEVAAALRTDGYDVTAVTLSGLESADADRSAITMSYHVGHGLRRLRSGDGWARPGPLRRGGALPTLEELKEDPSNSLEGLSAAEQLETFRRRMVPKPSFATSDSRRARG